LVIGSSRSVASISGWGDFRALYPPHRLDEEAACRAFGSRKSESAAILAGLRAAVKSSNWTEANGKYVPKASRFIGEGLYKNAARMIPGEPVPPGIGPDGKAKPGWTADGRLKFFDPREAYHDPDWYEPGHPGHPDWGKDKAA
jgi:hypothetical protein